MLRILMATGLGLGAAGTMAAQEQPSVFDILSFFDQTNPTLLLPWF